MENDSIDLKRIVNDSAIFFSAKGMMIIAINIIINKSTFPTTLFKVTFIRGNCCCCFTVAPVVRSIINAFRFRQVNPSTLDAPNSITRHKFVV